MNQPISRQQHGLADYSYIPLTLALPKLAGFENEKNAVLLTRLIAGNVTLSTLFTRAEWGVFRVLPFKAHLALDALAAGLCPPQSRPQRLPRPGPYRPDGYGPHPARGDAHPAGVVLPAQRPKRKALYHRRYRAFCGT
jgi:hypothetical protein